MPIDLWIDVDEDFAEKVDAERIEHAVGATLARLGIEDAELSVVITSDDAVQIFNRDFRGVDAPTDVLSFPAQGEIDELTANVATGSAPEMPDDLRAEVERQLGDVIIAFPYAERQAARLGNTVAEELLLLAVHGTLHLVGYDHATGEDEDAMWALQEQILADYGIKGLSQRDHDA